MAIKYNSGSGSCNSSCSDKFGCPTDRCPDFTIRRHDTRPAFKVAIDDCDGPMDFRGLVIEVNMWASAKLKADITSSSEYFRLADDVGFEQVMVGDIIIMDRVRMPERMLVVAFDEHNRLIKVQRGYHSTTASDWKKGSKMRIFRILDGAAESEMLFEDVQNIDGTTDRDVLQSSHLVYEWAANDTCLPGCYWLEFKVLKMIDIVWLLPGGYWVGETHTHTDGFFYTGATNTSASVKLSYDQVADKYMLPHTPWSGDIHEEDGEYYTGDTHSDGSVLLNKNGITSDSDTAYDEDGIVSLHDDAYPEFTDEELTSQDFGCTLGEGVEWVRRFPVNGEGFLIKIEFSPTSEL